MEILIVRQERNKHSTLGELFVNGVRLCDTLEPVDLGAVLGMEMNLLYEHFKVGQSALPQGNYECQVSWNEHKKHYLPKIMNVPFCSESYISWGYTWRDNPKGITIGKWNTKFQILTYGKFNMEDLLAKIHSTQLIVNQPINLKIVWQEF